MKVKPCKGCGAGMIWVRGENGTPIPLDELPSREGRYHVTAGGQVRRVTDEEAEEMNDASDAIKRPLQLRRSHFETCPHAGAFSKPKAKPAEKPSPVLQGSLFGAEPDPKS